MKIAPTALRLLAAGFLAAACGAPPADTSPETGDDHAAVHDAMDAVYERFVRAYRLAEPDSVLALYTDDPLYLPGRGDIVRGREGVRGQFRFLRSLAEEGGSAHISFESVARGRSGDLAWDVGYYTLRQESAEGNLSSPTRGKFTTVWERGPDGHWRIRIDSFSPAPPQDA